MKSWCKIQQFFKTKRSSLPKKLLKILSFVPNNDELFVQAITPKNAKLLTVDGKSVNYERLEFLGDAILDSVISEFLYINQPLKSEGYLTKIRSKIVSREHLNKIGESLELSSIISYRNNLDLSTNINGDIYEALVGAVFLDQGYNKCKSFIYRTVIDSYVDLDELENKIISYKNLIIQWSQKAKFSLKFNTIIEENAQKGNLFVSTIQIGADIVAKGRGTSKKKAEENASKRVYYKFQNKIENYK